MLEKEYKSMLTEEEYKRLKNHFVWDEAYEQTNNYYSDGLGIIQKHRIMFRVREKAGKSVIQVKFHKNKNSPLQICEENEFGVDKVPEVIENGEKYTGLKTGPLKRLGRSVTLRHSKMWDDKTEICLDKTSYFDRVDYELEVEYTTDKINKKLLSELKELGIEFKISSKGKFSRFLERLYEIKNNN